MNCNIGWMKSECNYTFVCLAATRRAVYSVGRYRSDRSFAVNPLQFSGHFCEFGERIRVHLLHHLAAVQLDRDLAEIELGGDLFV